MHLLFDPVVLAVPGAGTTAQAHLTFAEHLVAWDEVTRGAQHTCFVSAELNDALWRDGCYPDQTTLRRRWGEVGLSLSPELAARVAQHLLSRVPYLETFFARDLSPILVEDRSLTMSPDLAARLPEATATALRHALARAAWLRDGPSLVAGGHDPSDLLLATHPIDGRPVASLIRAEVLADDGLVSVEDELPLVMQPQELDGFFDLMTGWREPATTIRTLARAYLATPPDPVTARRLERFRVGDDFCDSLERCQIDRRKGYLRKVFRLCILLMADDPSTHDEKQHHRLARGTVPINHGRWQAWRLWVNNATPGYRLHYWRDGDEFIFMHVRFHDDLSIESPRDR